MRVNIQLIDNRPLHTVVVNDLAAGDRVFVRWRQTGRHLGSIDGETPSGRPLVELTSAVYRVNGGRIVEYWIQMDRKGLELQLAAETRTTPTR